MNASVFYTGLHSVESSWSEGLLILMYHSVAVPPLVHRNRGLHVTSAFLDRHLRELQAREGIQFASLEAWNKEPVSSRRVLLTFDDAYRNVFTSGLPVLQRHGVRAITYVVASLIGKSNEWDDGKGMRWEKLMDRAELKEWIEAGNEIGAHSMTHRNLARISPEEARREIFDSKKLLEDTFGRPVRHFCYPYGDQNRAVRDLVAEAGYETATTTSPGFNGPATDPFALCRLPAMHQRPWLVALTGR